MVVKTNNTFRSLAKFWYKNKHYHMFANDQHKLAFLIIDDEGKYHYPELRDLLEVTYVFASTKRPGIMGELENSNRKRRRPKKFSFIPKAITATSIVAITATLLGTFNILDENNLLDPVKTVFVDDKNEDITITVERDIPVISFVEDKKEEEPDKDIDELSKHVERIPDKDIDELSKHVVRIPREGDTVSVEETEPEGKRIVEVDDPQFAVPVTHYYHDFKVERYLTAADDEYDYMWDSDFRETDDYIILHDAGHYDRVFDVLRPTQEQLFEVIDNNDGISDRYKGLVKEFILDWLSYYPDADFTVFYKNLQTLKIVETTSQEIKDMMDSPYTIACYNTNINTIYLGDDSDPTVRGSRDHITLYHELIHAARDAHFELDGKEVNVTFYYGDMFGVYTNESLVSNLSILLDGATDKSFAYDLSCNYFRIIQDCLGESFTGTDYLNHSINYLCLKMDEYMNDDGYALHILDLIDTEMAIQYNERIKGDGDNFIELYDYLTRMYMKKHLSDDMSYEQAEAVYSDFMRNITHSDGGFYPVNEQVFRDSFNRCCVDLGIAQYRTR